MPLCYILGPYRKTFGNPGGLETREPRGLKAGRPGSLGGGAAIASNHKTVKPPTTKPPNWKLGIEKQHENVRLEIGRLKIEIWKFENWKFGN